MRVSRILLGVALCVALVGGWLVLQPNTGESQTSPASEHWSDRFLSALTPDSLIARHTVFDTLPDGLSRIERIVPFLSSPDYGALGNDFMGCPCCPEPRMATWKRMGGDSLPPLPPCCIPCLVLMENQIITRRSPLMLTGDKAPYISTRQPIPAGIISVSCAIEIRRNGNAVDSLPVNLDIAIKGVDVTPLPTGEGPLSVKVPPGMRQNGHLHAVGFRRDFLVTGGVADIALLTDLSGEHSGEQIANGVLEIVLLPNQGMPGTH